MTFVLLILVSILISRLQVLGLASPASQGGVLEGDVLVSVEDTLVTLMKHAQVRVRVLCLQSSNVTPHLINSCFCHTGCHLFLIVSCTNCQPFQLFYHVTVSFPSISGKINMFFEDLFR